MATFKITRLTQNGKDLRIAGLYYWKKPAPAHPYWEFHYKAVGEKPAIVLYLTGNICITNALQEGGEGDENT